MVIDHANDDPLFERRTQNDEEEADWA